MTAKLSYPILFADFHQNTYNPMLHKFLGKQYEYAKSRAEQFQSSDKVTVVKKFCSIYRRRLPDEVVMENSDDNVKYIIDLRTIINHALINIVPGQVFHMEGCDVVVTPSMVDSYMQSGVRSFGLMHNHDNQLGGGARGDKNRGLTDLGKEIISHMGRRRAIIDLAHMNHKTMEDTLKLLGEDTHIVVTHTAIGDSDQRFTPLEIAQEVARRGGIVGFTPNALFYESFSAFLGTLNFLSNMIGADHIAIGTDFGGVDSLHLFPELQCIGDVWKIAEELRTSLSIKDIEKIMYKNVHFLQ